MYVRVYTQDIIYRCINALLSFILIRRALWKEICKRSVKACDGRVESGGRDQIVDEKPVNS